MAGEMNSSTWETIPNGRCYNFRALSKLGTLQIAVRHYFSSPRIHSDGTAVNFRLVWMNIEPAILKYMEDCKTARLDRARQALLVTRFRIMEQVIATPLLELSKTTPVPRVIDICLTNQARSILDVPSDRTLTAADLAPLIPLLPALTQSWYAKIESQYIQHVSSNERTTPSGSVLELVTSCKRCKHVLFFPDSLTHVCHNLPRARRKEDQPKGKAKRMTWQERQDFNLGVDLIRRLPVYERATRDLSACVPWSCDQDSIEREDGVVRGIIEACGKSSDEVTCKEMDDSDARLLCDMCSQDGRLLVVTWRSAVGFIVSRIFLGY